MKKPAKPTFSVIIPVINGEKTISRAIKSVLKQTYPAKEIIVIDDGSTDNTKKIVKKLQKKNKKIKYIHQKHLGVSVARNKGAKTAKSEWLTFLDSDDYYYPNRLKWHAQLIQKHSDLDFLTGNIKIKKPNGQLIKRFIESVPSGKEMLKKAKGASHVIMEEPEMESFIEMHFGNTDTITIPRKKFLEIGGYNAGERIGEDATLLIKLCSQSKRVGIVCKATAAYIIHNESACRKNPLKSQKETVETFLNLKKDLKNAPAHIKRELQKRINDAKINLAYTLLKEGKKINAIKLAIFLAILSPKKKNLHDALSIIKDVLSNKNIKNKNE